MAKAKQIKDLVQTKLWDADAQFFKVLPRGEATRLVDVRELHGYTPWYFNLPDKGKGYGRLEAADGSARGSSRPFGPTTAEQRHPKFQVSYKATSANGTGQAGRSPLQSL